MERTFLIGQVAEFFFDRNTPWLRHQETMGRLTREDGSIIGQREKSGKKGGLGDRHYSEDDVMEIAKTLVAQQICPKKTPSIVRKRLDALAIPIPWEG